MGCSKFKFSSREIMPAETYVAKKTSGRISKKNWHNGGMNTTYEYLFKRLGLICPRIGV